MDQAGSQRESIDIADNRLNGCERTTTINLHVGQTYVDYPKMHNFDVAHALKTVKSPHRARFMKCTTYVGPLPPLRCILYAPTVIQPKRILLDGEIN